MFFGRKTSYITEIKERIYFHCFEKLISLLVERFFGYKIFFCAMLVYCITSA